MRTNVKAKNVELTRALSDYIEKKVSMLGKLIDGEDTVAVCDVEVGKPSKHHHTGDVFYAEFNVKTSRGHFRATTEAGTLYGAIDKTKDDIQRELRRHKRKRLHIMKRGGSKFKEITQRLAIQGTRFKSYVERYRRKRKK